MLLDPVGAGASGLRTKTANELVRDIKFTVIRGNISEIRTLMEGTGNTKGVDEIWQMRLQRRILMRRLGS